jgi:hypothetical protein
MKRSKKLNVDAMVVWFYIWETAKHFDNEYQKDFDFMRLVANMTKHYRDEFEAISALSDMNKRFG